MDLAIYISELLGLEGEVNLPGIGHFEQIRNYGYYDEHENKFHPPFHRVNFQQQSTEDDALAKYISNKKNISLASSEYFIDKYVIGLKQQAASQKVHIGGLGYLQSDNSLLAFKANDSIGDSDPAFYGLTPLKIYKIGQQPAVVHEPVVIEAPVLPKPAAREEVPFRETPAEALTDEPVSAPEVIAPEEVIQQEQEYTFEEPERRRVNIWVVLLLLISIVALALAGIYQYRPSLFDQIMGKKQLSPVAKPVVVKTDTVTKSAPVTDTTAKSTPAVVQQPAQTAVDTFAVVHYDILGGAYKTLERANSEIKKYQQLGLTPGLLQHAKGKLYKINLGTYFNKTEAEKAKDSILNIPHITKSNIYLQPYIPKK